MPLFNCIGTQIAPLIQKYFLTHLILSIMEEILKKFLYTSVGLVAYTSEKIQKVVNDLVAQSKISEDEGKKIVEDFLKDTEGKREEIEAKFKDVAENLFKNLEFMKKKESKTSATRAEDIESKLGMGETVETETVVEVK